MAIKIIVDLTCDIPHPGDFPCIEIPPDTFDVKHFVQTWMLQHGWSMEVLRSGISRMLCPACTYRRLSLEGYDGVFL